VTTILTTDELKACMERKVRGWFEMEGLEILSAKWQTDDYRRPQLQIDLKTSASSRTVERFDRASNQMFARECAYWMTYSRLKVTLHEDEWRARGIDCNRA
jgi:hypothetical protein